jgi:hypothetical protein
MSRIPLCALLLVLTGCGSFGPTQERFAVRKIRHLTEACQSYRLTNGDWPTSLDTLAGTEPDGRHTFLYADDLTDPWGHPYQYDPAGPKNDGQQPDIWTRTPQGKEIGNWPDGH